MRFSGYSRWYEYNKALHIRQGREAAKEDGLQEGLQEGLRRSVLERISKIQKKYLMYCMRIKNSR